MKIKTLCAAAVVGTVICVSAAGITPAQAASFKFSYTTETGNTLSGLLEGDIQGDGDTVIVSSITQSSLNGAARPSLPFVQSYLGYFFTSPAPAKVSFSGSQMDILASTTPNPFIGDNFIFDASQLVDRYPVYFFSPLYANGNSRGIFEQRNWSLTAATPIPTPAMLPGLIGLGIAAWKKRNSKQSEQVSEPTEV